MPSKDNIQLDKADAIARRVHLLFLASIRDISKLAVGLNIDDSKPFSINDYPNFKKKIDNSLNELTAKSVSYINQATEEQWLDAYEKNMDIAKPYLNRKLLTKTQQLAYESRNLDALQSFQQRKINGLNLSKRIWKYNNQFKGEIEMGIDTGLKEGMSAQQLSRKIRQTLQEPEQLFRRVRDKHGNLHLSKIAKKYHPGGGVYRSSYKNAMRLARTEVNMAYRASDHEKYKQLDFVVGFEVKRSNRVFGCSVCEPLKGEYPKNFKFVGWHPQCRCFTVPIMNKLDKFIEQQKALLNGEEYSQWQMRSLPKNFKDWYSKNLDRINAAKSLPYFLKDNAILTKGIKKPVKKIVPKKFVYDNSVLDHYREYATVYTDGVSAYNYNQVLGDFNIKDLLEEVDDILDEKGLQIEHISFKSEFGGMQLTVKAAGAESGYMTLSRRFYNNYGAKSVDHTYFTLSYDLQGKGLSKELFGTYYKQYKNAGIEEINVHANIDVGGYTWGKYGFSQDIEKAYDWLEEIPDIESDMYVEITNILDTWKKKNPKRTHFPMNLLSNNPKFKNTMLGSDWKGVLNLKNDVQRTIFESYIKS